MNTSLNAYLTKSLNEGFLKTSNSSIVSDVLNNIIKNHSTISKHYLCIDECDMLTSQDQLIKSRCNNGWVIIRNAKAMINNRY